MTDGAVKNKPTGPHSLAEPSVGHRAQRGYPWGMRNELPVGAGGMWIPPLGLSRGGTAKLHNVAATGGTCVGRMHGHTPEAYRCEKPIVQPDKN